MKEHFKGLKKDFCHSQYRPQRQGNHFDTYQLLQMQSQTGDFKDDKKRGRVAASYLVVESLKASGAGKLAKTAFLVPFDSFRRAISGSFNAQLQKAIPTGVDDYFVDDVASLTASQLNEVLEDGIIKLAPRPTDGLINKYLSNFLNDNSY
ncbi:hypothetical protein MMC34_007791 [Xylographa carneopallida]|nr:hypothetical protein [Xylographa carneopallida]